MKRFLFALAVFALLLPSAPKADAAEVSIDFFYSNLSGGSWIEVGDYGYCWQPDVAVSNRDWRPYADGYWAYTDVGWTWVSYEDFGWATYHYGRWSRLRDQGWVWVPGYEWGPAWVSWRTGGDYVGWAPLPPRRYGGEYARGEVVYEGRAIGTSVDIEFDIGPAYYNFVDVRYIGAPVLREHIYEPTQNINYINRTVNVTNITYHDDRIYNYGPDYNRLSAYSARPIQRLTLQRDTATDITVAAQAAQLSRVQGDRLVVATPPRLQRLAQPIAPKVVKTKVEKPDVETGWMGVTDPNAKAQLQEKMKKEDPKSVPPPQIPPKNPEALNAATAPGTAPAATAPIASETAAPGTREEKLDGRGRGRNKDKRGDVPAVAGQTEQPAGSAPAQGADAAAPPAMPQQDAPGRGKKNKDRRQRDQLPPDAPQPGAETRNTAPPDATSVAPGPAQDLPRGRGKRDRQQPANVPADAPVQPPAGAAPESAPPRPAPGLENDRRERGKKQRQRDDASAPPLQPATQPQDAGVAPPNPERPHDADRGGRGRGKEKRERLDALPAPDVAPPPPAAPREVMQERGRGRRERQEPPPQLAPPPQGGPGSAAGGPPPEERGKPERGNKKKDNEPKEP